MATKTKAADAVIRAALEQALNRGLSRRWGAVDANDVDAFTAALLDAGVDLDDLDAVIAQGDPTKIGLEPVAAEPVEKFVAEWCDVHFVQHVCAYAGKVIR